MAENNKFHPAVTVNNIKNFIPITLEMDNSKYGAWSELFKIHCKAYNVIDHITPQPTSSSTSTESTINTTNTESATTTESWDRLDVIVLQWIYGTVSIDLMETVMAKDSTALQVWDRLKGIFHDNEQTRAIHLQQRFSNIRLENFTNVSYYCQELKNISDQLNNVGSNLKDKQLVLQLIAGLNDAYHSIGTLLAFTKPLPSFYQARSMLILEETRRQGSNRGNQFCGRHNSGRGRSNSHRNYQRTNFYNSGQTSNVGPNKPFQSGPPPTPWSYNSWNWQNNTWASPPPCPYPTVGWPRPTAGSSQPGILGPRPNASYANSVTSSTPTDIEAAMHSMSLNPLTKIGTLTPAQPHTWRVLQEFPTGTPIMWCNSTGDLYPLDPSKLHQRHSPSVFSVSVQDLWHQRLSHPGVNVLKSLRNKNYVQCNSINKLSLCQSCVFGKHVRLPFYASTSTTFNPFDIIHSDLWTSPVVSTNVHRYYILFLDDLTNFLWTVPLSHKSHVYNVFLTFQTLIKTQFGKQIKAFQCDNGTEYNNTSFHNFCATNGMVFRFSCPYTSSQNGKAERKIRAINNIMRTIMSHASVPQSFWPHALEMATYLLNILPSKLLNNLSPTQLLYQRIPEYQHLKVFGCLCYPLIPSTTIKKLQPRSTPCVFLGYPKNHRGYKCYDISTKKIILSRHVLFNENIFPFSSISNTSTPSYQFLHDNIHPYFLHSTHNNTFVHTNSSTDHPPNSNGPPLSTEPTTSPGPTLETTNASVTLLL
ncbi:uncharacterized protein [Rutidosis leptorrhynchoides]|uniref:uncharacterized protein n=1 Tax=Rutidosis leptorrhynchoides TaxID=125765 RepID=UPI003A99F75D